MFKLLERNYGENNKNISKCLYNLHVIIIIMTPKIEIIKEKVNYVTTQNFF